MTGTHRVALSRRSGTAAVHAAVRPVCGPPRMAGLELCTVRIAGPRLCASGQQPDLHRMAAVPTTGLETWPFPIELQNRATPNHCYRIRTTGYRPMMLIARTVREPRYLREARMLTSCTSVGPWMCSGATQPPFPRPGPTGNFGLLRIRPRRGWLEDKEDTGLFPVDPGQTAGVRPVPEPPSPGATRGTTPRKRLTRGNVVGLAGIEPATSALSVLRSNRLSYSPQLVPRAGQGDPVPQWHAIPAIVRSDHGVSRQRPTHRRLGEPGA